MRKYALLLAILMVSGCATMAQIDAKQALDRDRDAYLACIKTDRTCASEKARVITSWNAYNAATNYSMGGQMSPSGVQAPAFGAGTPVYSPSQCTGPIVAGVCHGGIIPTAGWQRHCYGQMLNGICTGPMF